MPIIDYVKSFKNFVRHDGEFGLEVETSTLEAYKVPEFTYWTTHQDDSVRDFGKEYVLKQPLKFEKELPLALNEFRDKTSKIKFIKDPQSASVHVHVNFLNESFKTLGNFLTTYALVENLLIHYSGPDRVSNLYCLPIQDAEITYKNIVSLFKAIQSKQYKQLFLNTEQAVKYAACNIAALGSYGSIELRSFRGETNTDKIHLWIAIINCILKYARGNRTPKDIMNSWRINNLDLLNEIFGDLRKEIKHQKEKELIEKNNVFYAGSIAYSVRDWGELDTGKVEVFKPSKKELDSAAMGYFGRPFDKLAPGEQEYIVASMKLTWANQRNIPVDAVQMAEVPEPVVPVRPRAGRLRAERPLEVDIANAAAAGNQQAFVERWIADNARILRDRFEPELNPDNLERVWDYNVDAVLWPVEVPVEPQSNITVRFNGMDRVIHNDRVEHRAYVTLNQELEVVSIREVLLGARL